MERTTDKFRVKDWLSRTPCLLIIGLYVLSLLPLNPVQKDDDNSGLRALITQVQQLQESSNNSKSNFNNIFFSTISSLKTVAGLITFNTKQSDNSDSEQNQITVSTKVSVLIPNSLLIPGSIPIERLPIISNTICYQSHIIPPELPPPIV